MWVEPSGHRPMRCGTHRWREDKGSWMDGLWMTGWRTCIRSEEEWKLHGTRGKVYYGVYVASCVCVGGRGTVVCSMFLFYSEVRKDWTSSIFSPIIMCLYERGSLGMAGGGGRREEARWSWSQHPSGLCSLHKGSWSGRVVYERGDRQSPSEGNYASPSCGRLLFYCVETAFKWKLISVFPALLVAEFCLS